LEQCVALNQHPLAKDAPGAAEVLPNLYLGSTTETLQHWKDHDALHPESCRFFLGYAGWSFFQLDCETSNDWWFTLPAQSNTPFLNEPEGLWLASLKKLGAEFYDAGLAFINADLE
jgi:putative transcriptional regulator